ncbi:hypothetical protein CA242_10770 [Sphingomonas koreensis]|uniref:hypothetical protein n=1 Tax=Sphingomonas koreensis TaxID=93064 RepID=UPI000F7DE7FF|nr:hypothetical protein [Sphingomonas koreensis]RSV09431.1 hypothetical protein CA242_10770 [Sphingomonas koreensis]
MKDSLFQAAKFWLVDATGLAKDALHIHVGLIVFFAAALAAALAGEAWDLWESLSEGRRILLWANWKDVWNTMLWPSAILLLARGTRLFGTGRR